MSKGWWDGVLVERERLEEGSLEPRLQSLKLDLSVRLALGALFDAWLAICFDWGTTIIVEIVTTRLRYCEFISYCLADLLRSLLGWLECSDLIDLRIFRWLLEESLGWLWLVRLIDNVIMPPRLNVSTVEVVQTVVSFCIELHSFGIPTSTLIVRCCRSGIPRHLDNLGQLWLGGWSWLWHFYKSNKWTTQFVIAAIEQAKMFITVLPAELVIPALDQLLILNMSFSTWVFSSS